MSSSMHSYKKKESWLDYALVGVLAPLFLSYFIPYLRVQNGGSGASNQVLINNMYIGLFAVILVLVSLFILKRIVLESILISLLLGLLLTGAALIMYVQRELFQNNLIHEGNKGIYIIAFVFYFVCLVYRLIRVSRWTLGTREIAVTGLLIAMNIALGKVGITTPVVRITFAFLPTALIAFLFGPWVGGVAAVFSDLLSFILGGGGAFFPGFTISAFLTGLIYGLLIHKKQLTLKRVIIAEVLIAVFIHIGLNTVWIHMLTNNPLVVILPPRLIQNAVTLVVRVMSIWFITTNKQLKRVYMRYSRAQS